MNSTASPLFKQLESGTRKFRDRHAKHHREAWVAAHRRAAEVLDAWAPEGGAGTLTLANGESLGLGNTEYVADEMRAALSRKKWHEGRDNGQKYRFRKLAQCGTRVMVASCAVCSHERRPVEEGCGIARLCERCSLRAAKKRRARFGRARKRVAGNLARLGCMRMRKVAGKLIGARWSDKMLTLTLPHFLRSHLDEDAPLLAFGVETCKLVAGEIDTTMARVLALRAAWPRFAAKMRKHWAQAEREARRAKRPSVMVTWRDGATAPPPMHRAFEWTPGADALGHPHYHVWMLAPWLHRDVVAGMWTEALREVGVPLEPDQRAIIDLRRFRDFNNAAVGELIKDGTKQKALEWSRLYHARATVEATGRRGGDIIAGPSNAFEYADGWTIAEALQDVEDGRIDASVVSSLYCALEKMRLTQASAGFFAEDEPPHCEGCHAQMCWHIRFDRAPEPDAHDTPHTNRGPPS